MKLWMLALLLVSSVFGTASCSKFKIYDGPPVTGILVYKESRMMYLLHENKVLAAHRVHLGFAPVGDKEREGDGRTPEGAYLIDGKNPDSEYHLSLRISYPDAHDQSEAREAGAAPGGDIFIHGGPNNAQDRRRPDWTAGCIAVSDSEIEDIYAMVTVGTPITIYP